MPELLHVIQVRCCHKTVDGRKLSGRGTMRIARIYRYVGKPWTQSEPVASSDGFSPATVPSEITRGTLKCPLCGCELSLYDVRVQTVLDSYLDRNQRPGQILLHYVASKAVTLEEWQILYYDRQRKRWEKEKEALEQVRGGLKQPRN